MKNREFLSGGGDMGALMRSQDWSSFPLGLPETWPQSLRTALGIMLNSTHPMFLAWGPGLHFFFNDAYRPILGAKPIVQGLPFAEIWSDIWSDIHPLVERALAGDAVWFEDRLIPMERNRFREDAYFSFSYSPIRDETGGVAGMFCACIETTGKVMANRRLLETQADLRRANERLEVEREAVREINRKLASESDFLRRLFEQAPGFMAVLRGADHVFDLTNAAYSQLVGHRPLLGKPAREALPEVVNQGFFELLEHVWTTCRPFVGRQMRIKLQREPGGPAEDRYVDFVYQPITDSEGRPTGIFVEGSDVTEAKLTEMALRAREEQLRSSEEKFRQLADLGPAIVWFGNADGTLSYLNRRWYEYTGQTLAQALPSGWTDMIHPDDMAQLLDAWAEARANGALYSTEARFRRHDGEYRWYLIRAEPLRDEASGTTGWLGSNSDIHDRRMMEEALRDERDRLWRMSGDLMDVCRADGTLLAVNPAWTRILGWSEKELLATRFTDLIHPDDLADTLAEMTSLDGGRPTLRFENRFRHRDGSYRSISWTATPENGVFYAVGRDITSQRESAEALQQAEEALRQAQKMEAVGQLTGGIAHDFNNLLTGILGSLEMIQTRVRQGRIGELERYATAAASAANRAAALTHRLLAFSRRQPLDPKPVDINRLVTAMEDLLHRTLGEAIDMETVTAASLWSALCDQHQLESALLNLAINARDAMPDGGKLTVETCNVLIDPSYAVRLGEVKSGQYICICVSDTGIGMSKEVIERAFDPFFTTKPIGQGTGLGLSMVYGFARQSEGFVRIYSELGKGTTVKIYLPRHYGTSEPQAASAASTEFQRGAGEAVLVVEDEPTVRDLVSEILRDLGYRVLEATDGPSGLRMLMSDIHIDLLVTDVGLPGLNGRQLADAALARRPGLKVLFMTGYAENAALAGGFLAPGMEMVTKPFAVEAFATRIRDMIERS
jgi:PAS domain S-box-containing protein